MGFLEPGNTAERLTNLENAQKILCQAMWALQADSKGKSSGTLSPAAIALIEQAAQIMGITL